MNEDLDQLRLEGQNLDPFLATKYTENYSYQNMSKVTVVFLFLYSSMKNIRKIQRIFDIKIDFENQNCAIFDLSFQIIPNT